MSISALQALESHWQRATASMRKVRGWIAKALGYAVAMGYRPRGTNPVAWADGLEHRLPSPGTHRKSPAVPYAPMPAFMAELRKDERPAARLLGLVYGAKSIRSGACGRFRPSV